MTIDCAYKTVESPKDKTEYERVQKLADIKIANAFTQNESLKKAIYIVEEYVLLGKMYDLDELKDLAKDNANDSEAFEELLAIL